MSSYSIIGITADNEVYVVEQKLTHSKAITETNRRNYRLGDGKKTNIITYMIQSEK